jgi:hypothetical protein
LYLPIHVGAAPAIPVTGSSSSSQWEGFQAPIVSFHHGEFFKDLPRSVLKVFLLSLAIYNSSSCLPLPLLLRLMSLFVSQANVREALGWLSRQFSLLKFFHEELEMLNPVDDLEKKLQATKVAAEKQIQALIKE